MTDANAIRKALPVPPDDPTLLDILGLQSTAAIPPTRSDEKLAAVETLEHGPLD